MDAEAVKRETRAKAAAVARCLATPDGQMLLRLLEEKYRTIQVRASADAPIDPYLMALSVGAQAVMNYLCDLRDMGHRTGE
jgi:hypothetical protein